jgi:hypothetical protein
MKFTVISEITHIHLIAKGNGVDIRHYLNRTYAGGRRVNWRKLKGRAIVEYVNGEIWEVELHWFETSGIGRKDEKDKQKLRRLA